MRTLEENKADLKQWGEAARKAKVMELEAAMRFILRNQPYPAFFDVNESQNKDRGFQGRMFIDLGNEEEAPILFVNWDETSPFDNQQELFEEIFVGDFSSDKTIQITGVKL